MNNSIESLVEFFADDDLDTNVRLESLTWENEDAILRLLVSRNDQPNEVWMVRCLEVRSSRLGGRFIDRIALMSDHPVLLPHMHQTMELYFNGRPAAADAVVGQLLNAHREIVGEWIEFEHYISEQVPSLRSPQRLLEGGHGLFAKGPQPLMEAYAAVLRKNGIDVSTPSLRPPVRWKDGRWVEESIPLFALILGDSFFVAREFKAERHK